MPRIVGSFFLCLVATSSACASGDVGAVDPVTGSPESPTMLDGGVTTSPSGGADSGSTTPPRDATMDAGAPPAAPSRCAENYGVLECSHHRTVIVAGGLERVIFWQTPSSPPPPGGYPVVFVFQPSIYWAEAHWTGFTTIAGQRYATETIQTLLDAGYAVITPQAQALVDTVWETNLPPFSGRWETSHDHALMLALFDGIANGSFGRIDASAMFATGMSSGGYMTSRMALSYPGRFRALVIQSAAWATCVGPINTYPIALVCNPADPIPAQHPPTLFVHGNLDTVVAFGTMRRYRDALADAGVVTRSIDVPLGGHQFFAATPAATLGWFDANLPDHLR